MKYYGLLNKKLFPMDFYNYKEIIWCDLLEPTEEEIDFIISNFKINKDDIRDCLDVTERPRYNYDILKKNHLILFRSNKMGDIDLKENPTFLIGIFITEDFKIITIRNHQENYFSAIFKTIFGIEINHSLLIPLEILKNLIAKCDKHASQISLQTMEIHKFILESNDINDIKKPFELNAYLILFNTAMYDNLKGLRAFFYKNKKLFEPEPDLFERIDDIVTDIEQVFNFTSVYRDLLSNSLDASASIINNNLSQVMKIVGSISLILMIPTMIASFFGMNTYLPGVDQGPPLFYVIILTSIGFSTLAWFFFKKFRWL